MNSILDWRNFEGDDVSQLLLQDENSGRDGRRYNEWHASRPEARMIAREVARKLGTEAAERCRSKADEACPRFSERAFEYIEHFARFVRPDGQFTGEDLVNNMKLAGIKPHDDRSFGAIFSKAIRANVIRPIGYAPRVKGHGTAGGRIYTRGSAA